MKYTIRRISNAILVTSNGNCGQPKTYAFNNPEDFLLYILNEVKIKAKIESAVLMDD